MSFCDESGTSAIRNLFGGREPPSPSANRYRPTGDCLRVVRGLIEDVAAIVCADVFIIVSILVGNMSVLWSALVQRGSKMLAHLSREIHVDSNVERHQLGGICLNNELV